MAQLAQLGLLVLSALLVFLVHAALRDPLARLDSLAPKVQQAPQVRAEQLVFRVTSVKLV